MCKHQWASLLAQKNQKVLSVNGLRICVECGMFKIGRQTIRISKDRIDMDSKPIKNVGKLLMTSSGRLKIPVGTDLYE